MKVLHVIPSVGALRGGPSVMLRTITRSLAAAGVEVHVATTDDNGPGRLKVPLGRPTTEDGVVYWYFPRQSKFYTVSLPLGKWLSMHVQDYDLIHIHALFTYATVSAARWAIRGGRPYIIRPLGTLNRWGIQYRRPWLKKLSFRLIEQRIVRNAAAMHYTSEQERVEALELGVDSRSAIVPNALSETPQLPVESTGLGTQYSELKGREIVLFMSRLDRKKGLDLLLPAFARVLAEYPNAALVIAGAGEPAFVAELKRTVDQLGLQKAVVWTGFLEGTKKWEALAGAAIFVLPSYSENFGIAIIEALAAGLPVVISDQVAIHREISASGCGIVVPCDAPQLAAGILHLLRDARLRKQFSARGARLILDSFSLSAVTDQIVTLYTQVAADRVCG